MLNEYPPPSDPESGESDFQRLERRWSEQLSELRVTQTGTQIMTGFLLTLPFQPAFSEITGGEKMVYLALLITATLATVTAIAPVSFHRILFGHPGAKIRVVAITQTLLQVTLTLVALVLSGTIALVFNIVVGAEAAVFGFVATLIVTLVIWAAMPIRMFREQRTRENDDTSRN